MEQEKKTLMIQTLVDDPYFNEITIVGKFKLGVSYSGDNPWALECAVLKEIAKRFPAIIQYYESCLKTAYASKEFAEQQNLERSV